MWDENLAAHPDNAKVNELAKDRDESIPVRLQHDAAYREAVQRAAICVQLTARLEHAEKLLSQKGPNAELDACHKKWSAMLASHSATS